MQTATQGILSAIQAMPKERYQDPTIEKTSRGAYFIRPWVDVVKDGKLGRKRKTIPLGPSDMGERKAKAEKTRIMATINQGRYVAQAQTTLDTLLPEYAKHVDKLGYATRCKYECHIKKHIQPRFGSSQLCEITSVAIQNWLDSIKLSWNTKTDIRNVLSGIFTQAKAKGYWKESNPVEGVWVGRKETVWEQRKLSIAQTRALLAALDPMPRIVCMVGLFTTLRISEILGLQEKHLNFAGNVIEVRQRWYRGDLDRTKTKKSTRDVTMGGLVEYLSSLITGDPERFVFITHESCRTDENLRKRHLIPAATGLGLYYTGFGFHSLRREAITEIGKKVAPNVIMNMAGHTKMDLSMLYSLNDAENARPAAEDYYKRVIN